MSRERFGVGRREGRSGCREHVTSWRLECPSGARGVLAVPRSARGRRARWLDHRPSPRSKVNHQEGESTGEPSGGLESGLVASLTGSVRIAIVSGGAACLVGAAAVTLALPALWRKEARAVPAPGQLRPGPSRCLTCHVTNEATVG
jgi:hypothetical protein